MLFHTGRVWLAFVENERGSSLVIQLPHVLLSLVWVFQVRDLLLEGLTGVPGQERNRLLLESFPLLIIVLLHVRELRCSSDSLSSWFERAGSRGNFVLPEEVLAWLDVLVSNGVTGELAKRFRGGLSSSANREVPQTANVRRFSALCVVISR